MSWISIAFHSRRRMIGAVEQHGLQLVAIENNGRMPGVALDAWLTHRTGVGDVVSGREIART